MRPLHDFNDSSLEEISRRLETLRVERLKSKTRKAAVLIPLMLNTQNEPAFLFTKRSDAVGSHKGHVSFPGGMQDAEDLGSDEVTALRETYEEVGVAQKEVRVLGTFHELPAINGIRVTPIAGFLGTLDERALVASEAEIAEVFSLSLKQLLDPELRFDHQYERMGQRGSFPVFTAGPHPVWGLTALFLRRFLVEVMGVDFSPGQQKETLSFLGSGR